MKTERAFIRINISEIKTFVGINLLMGIKKQCSFRDYWSSSPDFHNTIIKFVMSIQLLYNRYFTTCCMVGYIYFA